MIMNRTGIFYALLLAVALNGMSQETNFKFWVQITDKNNNSYSVDRPYEFLSQRAIERRERQGISIAREDLPVTSAYLDSLEEHPLKIIYTSKWLNAAVIQTTDPGLEQTLEDLPFVSDVEYLYRSDINKKSACNKWAESSYAEYLHSDHQVEMLQGHRLHQMGYEGEGMIIAVLDGGFANTDIIPGFDSLFMNGRILGTRNFVEPDSSFFWKTNGSHGTNVLSIMGGNIPGQFKGSAPKASYWLIQTENVPDEFRIEEANWLAGAELADSVGADIINSSLGYSIGFTDTLHNYTYSDMDGKTTLVTRAAQLAASKGIVVVNSAGNSGRPSNPWGYITAPSDGENVLSIAAVDSAKFRAEFSSKGPSYDGRIKPDIAALGVGTWVILSDGTVSRVNGTSFSSPVVAGLAACLWQKNPGISNLELLDAIRSTSSLNPYPDNFLGYGIPNFSIADYAISGIHPPEVSGNELLICPNPASEYILLQADQLTPGKYRYNIYDIGGKQCIAGDIMTSLGNSTAIPVQNLSGGTYFIIISSDNVLKRGIFQKLR